MLILLPPSEGKTEPGTGPALALDELSFPELLAARRRVVDALVRLANGPRRTARAVLRVSERQDAEIERDAALLEAPAAAAGLVYSGVLFEALNYPALPARARSRADRWVVVSSALFGAVRLTDWIPGYRLSGEVALPRLGRMSAYWKRHLDTPMTACAGSGVVLDLRSGVYATTWQPPAPLIEHTVVGRVMQRRPDGSTVVVSHHNKATKGRLVRDLVTQATDPDSPEDLAHLLVSLGYDLDLVPPRPGRPPGLDIVVNHP